MDTKCSKLEALLHDECGKLDEAEEALKKAHWHLQAINEEHATLHDELHELQAGQPINGVWQQRTSQLLQRGDTRSQSASEQK